MVQKHILKVQGGGSSNAIVLLFTFCQCRYKLFQRLSKNATFPIASLPTTATKPHGIRTCHQIQQWKQTFLNPLNWSWKKLKNGLILSVLLIFLLPRLFLSKLLADALTVAKKTVDAETGNQLFNVLQGMHMDIVTDIDAV